MAINKTPRITVMIPVFNGGHYLTETFQSLRAQTFAGFEVIFADDQSRDESLALLRTFQQEDARFRVIALEKNHGSSARVQNVILGHALGEYVVYSSQDDLFSPDWLEQMLRRADQTGADAIIPDLVFYGSQQSSLIGVRGDRGRIISGREAVELSLDWTIPGNALWRAAIPQRLGFPDVGAWSDEYAVRCFFLACDRVAFCEGTFFYRQDNPEAITKKLSLKTFDSPNVDLHLFRMLQEAGFSAAVSLRALVNAMSRVVYLYRQMAKVPNADRAAARARVSGYLKEFSSADIRRFLSSNRGGLPLRDRAIAHSCTHGLAFLNLTCATADLLSMLRGQRPSTTGVRASSRES